MRAGPPRGRHQLQGQERPRSPEWKSKSYLEALGPGTGTEASADTEDKVNGDITMGEAGLSEVSTGTPSSPGPSASQVVVEMEARMEAKMQAMMEQHRGHAEQQLHEAASHINKLGQAANTLEAKATSSDNTLGSILALLTQKNEEERPHKARAAE